MLLLFLVGALSVGIVGVYSYFQAKHAILNRTLDQLTSIRVIKKSQIASFFGERVSMLNLLSAFFRAGPSGAVPSNTLPDSVVGYFGQIYYSDSSGVVRKAFDTKGPGITDSMLLAHIASLRQDIQASGSAQVSDLFWDAPEDSLPVCLIGAPVHPSQGYRTSILVLETDVRQINNIMLEKSRENGLGRSGEAYLVGPDRLMRSNSRFIPNSVLRTKVNTISVNRAFSDQTGSAIIDDYRTVPCLSSFSRLEVPGLPWVIIAEIDYDEAMIPIVSIRNDLVLISLVILLLVFSLAQFLSRTITQPLIRLKNATAGIGEGRFDIRVEATSHDEIGILSNTFNDMAGQLEQERNRRMTALFDGQELERQRIARELHDGLGQMLVALKLKFENAVGADDATPLEQLPALRNDFRRIIEEVRQVSYDLAPTGLAEFGLESSLTLLCREIRKNSSVRTEFASHGNFDGLPEKTRNYLFRIVQEALNNSVRHSGASNIYVHLMESPGQVVLIVEDDGKGFDPNQDPGNGLQNMRERARLLGGTLDLETAPGAGTTIRVKIPKKLGDHGE